MTIWSMKVSTGYAITAAAPGRERTRPSSKSNTGGRVAYPRCVTDAHFVPERGPGRLARRPGRPDRRGPHDRRRRGGRPPRGPRRARPPRARADAGGARRHRRARRARRGRLRRHDRASATSRRRSSRPATRPRSRRTCIASHAAGVGAPFPREVVRAMLLLRANTLALGHSRLPARCSSTGCCALLDARDPPGRAGAGERRRVGRPRAARAPRAAAHRARRGRGRRTGRARAASRSASPASSRSTLEPKEGLALLNGTQLMTRARGAARSPTPTASPGPRRVAAAMSVEALLGHRGRVRRAVPARPAASGPGRGRGASSATCCATPGSRPAHHDSRAQGPGPVLAALRAAGPRRGPRRARPPPAGARHRAQLRDRQPARLPAGGGGRRSDALATGGGLVISGGNFHGEPIALALDFAKLALAELGSISRAADRAARSTRGSTAACPRSSPPTRARNSGLMIVQYTAAALASENKVLAHPSSVDSIPTSANQEDHVSMGADRRRATRGPSSGTSSRSSRSSCCARPRRSTCGWRGLDGERPSTRRCRVPASRRRTGGSASGSRHLGEDREPGPDLATALALVHDGALADLVGDCVGPTADSVDSPAMAIRIVDVTDDATFALLPPCADPGFDHRSCDYWEDADRGSKAARALVARAAPRPPAPAAPRRGRATRSPTRRRRARRSTRSRPAPKPTFNPFPPTTTTTPVDNPFAPPPKAGPAVGADAPREAPAARARPRGRSGRYAKVLLDDDAPAVYAQFGPLSAYPRALRTRELYPQLPDAPLPAVITCIATTAGGARPRARGDARRGGVRRPRGARVRGRRDLPGASARGRTRRVPRRPRSGSGSGSPSRRRTTASRSCAGSSREPGDPRRPRPPASLLLLALVRRRVRRHAAVAAAAAAGHARRAARDPRRRRRRPPPSTPAVTSAPPELRPPSSVDDSLLAILPADVDGIAGHARSRTRSPRPPRTRTSRRNVEPGGVRGRRRRRRDLASGVVAQLRPTACSTTGSSATGATPTTRAPARRPAASPATPRRRSAGGRSTSRPARGGLRDVPRVRAGAGRRSSRCSRSATGRFGERLMAACALDSGRAAHGITLRAP